MQGGSHHLRAIDGRNESLAAFHLLKECLQTDSQVFPDHLIGWQGGGSRCATHWFSKLGFWAVLEESPPNANKRRFWNCFGINDPAQQHMLTITVEINPPHEGENRRVGGLFVRDEDGSIYIAHTGRVGGGRIGIGQNAFREFAPGHWWREIDTQSGTRIAALLGPIDSRDFANQVADFVHKVADFKERAVDRSAPR
jgi:hypothetical protein